MIPETGNRKELKAALFNHIRESVVIGGEYVVSGVHEFSMVMTVLRIERDDVVYSCDEGDSRLPLVRFWSLIERGLIYQRK